MTVKKITGLLCLSVFSAFQWAQAQPYSISVVSTSCEAVVLERPHDNPSYSFYWQTSATGTSTDNNSKTYTVTGAGTKTIYLRALFFTAWQTEDQITLTLSDPVDPGTISYAGDRVCQGEEITLTGSEATGGTGSYRYQWQKMEHPNAWFVDIAGATSPSLTIRLDKEASFVRNVRSDGCEEKVSNRVTVAPYDGGVLLSAGAINGAKTICYGQSAGTLGNATPANWGKESPSLLTYQWEASADHSTWSEISGANDVTYSPGTLTSSRYYRRKVATPCGEVQHTPSQYLTVLKALDGGRVGADVSVCYASGPGVLGVTDRGSGGQEPYRYQWEVSDDGTKYRTIDGATQFTYHPRDLTATQWYRRKLTASNHCGSAYSHAVKVTVLAETHPGTISYAGGRVCQGEKLTLTGSEATGGTGSYRYQWQKMEHPNAWFVDIAGATSPSLTIRLDKEASFVRNVRSDGCEEKVSNRVTVAPYDGGVLLSAGAINGAKTICYGQSAGTLGNATPANWGKESPSLLTYQWEASADHSTWSEISGANDVTYSPGTLTSSMYYRRKVATPCGEVQHTPSQYLTVLKALDGGRVGADVSVCYASGPGVLGVTDRGSGGQEPYRYQWEVSDDGTKYRTIDGATQFTYHPRDLTATQWYRRKLTASNHCGSAYSHAVKVTVLAETHPGTISYAGGRVCQGEELTLTGSEATGGTGSYRYQWQKMEHPNAWFVDIAGATSPSLTIRLGRETRYRRNVRSGECAEKVSPGVIVDASVDASPNCRYNHIQATYLRVATVEVAETEAVANTERSIAYHYFDGLGREVQTLRKGVTPGHHDLVTVTEYDAYGRNHLTSLPFVMDESNQGEMVSAGDQLAAMAALYREEGDFAYRQTRFEPSPLHRPLEQGAPGEAWQLGAATLTYGYEVNGSDEGIIHFDFSVLLSGTKTMEVAGHLQKHTITDEDENQTIEYTNKDGLVVLRKSYEKEAGEWAATYYLYDDFNLQRVIFPPEATARLAEAFFPLAAAGRQQFLDRWCYQYEYDGRRRMTRKKGPGTEPVRMVYDRWDRLALTQDGNQRAAGQWQFIKYDALNRPIMTGLVEEYAALKEAVEDPARTDRFETHLGAGYVPETHYTDTSHPRDAHIVEYHTITYYDSYAFVSELGTLSGTVFAAPDELALASQVDEFHLAPHQKEVVKGQVTGTRTKLLGASEDADGYLESILYYDDRYLVIQVVSENHLGGVDRISTQYDFGGNVRRVHRTHSDGTRTTEQLLEYDYDHADRLLSCDHTLNDGDKIRLYTHEYNERGELVKKHLHEKRDGAYAQTIDYAYNIRGWLTSINDANLSDENDLFGMNLYYTHNPVNETNTHFNGNISAMRWSAHGGRGTGEGHAYDFSYDGLNRLTAANYHTNGSTAPRFDVADIGYDRNGNILHLTRWGLNPGNLPGVMDDLSYTYRGNQLLRVSDTGGPAGFRDGNTSGDDYGYDANGNMTFDANKGITHIAYNHLNLPTVVTLSESEVSRIEYLHDAAGTKLRETVYEGGVPTKTTDYVGNFIYEDAHDGAGSKLQLIQHEEGRLVPDEREGTFDLQYHITDHLGNVRITFSTTPEHYEMDATMEDSNEQTMFSNYVATSDGAVANSGTHVFRNSNTVNGGLGMNTFLGVNKGDTIKASAYAYYSDAGGSYNLAAGLIEGALFGSFGANYGVEGATVTQTNFDNAFASGTALGDRSSSSSAPPAYINYLVFDKEMNFVTASFTQITSASNGSMAQVTATNYIADREGYVMVYLSNETQGAELVVSWDDFTVYHGKTNVVFSSNYYPFGLPQNEFNRTASVFQRNRFNGGSEWVPTLGMYMTQNRMYDPATGRFRGIDALADMFPTISPMAFSYNSPLKFNDPLGLNPCPDGNCDDVIPTNTGVEVVVTPSGNSSSTSTAINYNSLLFSSNPIHRAIGRARKDHNRNFMRHVVHNKTIHYSHGDYLSEISRTDNSGRLWQKIAAAGIGGSMLLTAGSPILIEAAAESGTFSFTLKGGLTRMAIEAGTQTIVNVGFDGTAGLLNLDVVDVALAGVGLNFISGAVIGAGVDFRPFTGNFNFITIGGDKSFGSFATDASVGLVTGGQSTLLNNSSAGRVTIDIFNTYNTTKAKVVGTAINSAVNDE